MRAISKMKWCHSLVLFTQLSALGIKCPALLVVFGVIFMLAYVYIHDRNFTWGGGRGLSTKKVLAAEKCIAVSEKFMATLEKKY